MSKPSMSRKQIMGQPSLSFLLREMILHEPGITSERLWQVSRDWMGKHTERGASTLEFDQSLGKMKEMFCCTNQRWYPADYRAEPERRSGPAPDPKQLRMFG